MRWLSADGKCAVVCNLILSLSTIINITVVEYLMEADTDFRILLAVLNSSSMSKSIQFTYSILPQDLTFYRGRRNYDVTNGDEIASAARSIFETCVESQRRGGYIGRFSMNPPRA